MSQAPGLEGLEQRREFDDSGMDLLLIVNKAIRAVVWYGVILFTDVSQNPEQALDFSVADSPKGSVLRRQEQGDEICRMFRDITVNQVTA